eukprot:TRINITY_DN47878_c0_g1_i1.p1 TRINITY_DN47878_c0_g1~~TRINITY_DN47878_c0_g1_i1.p1  ORF type:complete len:410 (+),score=73.09 TRINITY_DN47878_c0_g1_i1:37-1230(+)
MGMLRRVRPRAGFPWQLQAASLSVALAAAVCFGTSRFVPWLTKFTIFLLIWIVLWIPKFLVATVQWFFDPGVVVMHFPVASTLRAENKLPPLALTIDDSPVLEFDDGPADRCSTAQIRKSLERFGAKATWFVIGANVSEDRQELLQELSREGHELGNHGMYDRPAWTLSRDEFKKDVTGTQAVVERCGGGQRRWFRPGHAAFTPWKLSWLRENGYRVALGSIYPHDAVDLPPWQFSSPRLIAWLLVKKARAGDIIIIHDRPWTSAVLDIALPQLTERFNICTLSELAEASQTACNFAGPAPKSTELPLIQQAQWRELQLPLSPAGSDASGSSDDHPHGRPPSSSPIMNTKYTAFEDVEATDRQAEESAARADSRFSRLWQGDRFNLHTWLPPSMSSS